MLDRNQLPLVLEDTCVRSVMSSEMPSKYSGSPDASRIGTFFVWRTRRPRSRVVDRLVGDVEDLAAVHGLAVPRHEVLGLFRGQKSKSLLPTSACLAIQARTLRRRRSARTAATPLLDEQHHRDVFDDRVEKRIRFAQLCVDALAFAVLGRDVLDRVDDVQDLAVGSEHGAVRRAPPAILELLVTAIVWGHV